MSDKISHDVSPNTTDRRNFLSATSVLAMSGGLVASYGTFGVMAGQYLYSSGSRGLAWQFVGVVNDFHLGQSVEYTAPSGAKVVIARQNEGQGADSFIALSSVCPHLGCQVHWEPHNQRFFCPCHNGAFDPLGRATEGPPAKARQQLVRFPLRVDDGQLFIEAPMQSLTSGPREVSPTS
jgi:cytochrome b6-f complex iron-sulfur subunit